MSSASSSRAKANTEQIRRIAADGRGPLTERAAGILLAAGASRRMGRVKALLPHPDGSGRSLVRAAAETVASAGLDPLFVVLGHASRRIEPEIEGIGKSVRTVPNPDWRSGMLSSLKTGIRAASADPLTTWAVVAPVDQPFLSPVLVRRLLAAAVTPRTPTAMAAAPATRAMERQRTWGLPVVLHRELFPEVLALRRAAEGPDRGARSLLAHHRGRLRIIPATARELLDLDDPDAYQELSRQERQANK